MEDTNSKNEQLQMMMQAVQLASQHPEATQRVVQGASSAADAMRSADPEKKGSMLTGVKVVAGAAAVGGVAVGVSTGSVILGTAAAGGAAFAATQSSKVGDAARAAGSAAVAGYNKAKQIDEKHHLLDKVGNVAKATGSVIVSGYNKAKELDEKHHIVDSVDDAAKATGNALVSGYKKAKELDEKHHIIDKAKAAANTAAASTTAAAAAAGSKVVEMDRRYHVSQTASKLVHDGWDKAKELDSKHGVTRKVNEGIASSVAVVEKAFMSAPDGQVVPDTPESSPPPPPPPPEGFDGVYSGSTVPPTAEIVPPPPPPPPEGYVGVYAPIPKA
mmetsp:Transcript_18305/g.30564  ORF Transcript_18305/g.30564 Transcript_18305/m.30564 type:complete len:330 (-) Transcript_18305:166-1155(-)|eukprot:CAMPEP_0119340228 /NCGR_PEP_ID=MMETSP1333-20130426/99908_1 /TAXON_ID=418940 /ORGANISM="Scyphosphaera apsteinii, Strain RCC1455" /LENGTH=329 /DNA_ID=CAMNT_0007351927 /DNA_START=48 /DNA_END=1037 /DNA_ORIENTATION=+